MTMEGFPLSEITSPCNLFLVSNNFLGSHLSTLALLSSFLAFLIYGYDKMMDIFTTVNMT